MNEQSQQVFRNTIDKFQSKVNFVASCTNIQKVIDSIQSRFIIVNIKSIEKKGLYVLLKSVIENEEIKMSEDAINFVIDICKLSIKAMLNYLEKFKLINQEITLELALKTCTNIGFYIFETYVEKIKNKQIHDAIMLLYQLHDNGYSVLDILDSFFMFIKLTEIFTEDEKYKIIPILCKYISAFHDIPVSYTHLTLPTIFRV